MNTTDLPACINAKLTRYFEQLGDAPASGVHKMVMRETESIVVKFVLKSVNHNQSEAARILGISRNTLKKIQSYKV